MRAKGRGSFIFRHGILRYGTQVACALAVVQSVLFVFIILFTRESVRFSQAAIQVAIGWPISAIIFGSLIGHVPWKQNEKNYHQDDHVA